MGDDRNKRKKGNKRRKIKNRFKIKNSISIYYFKLISLTNKKTK